MYMVNKVKFFSCILILILSSCKPGPGGSDMLADAVVNSITSPVITNMTSIIIGGVGKAKDNIKFPNLNKLFDDKDEKKKEVTAKPSRLVYSELTDTFLCDRATILEDGKKTWYFEDYSLYVKEAKRRKLSCGVKH